MVRRRKRSKLRTNKFYHFAEIYRKGLTEESEIERIDFTKEFWEELSNIIKAGELINMNINAPPTSGKSITGMAIGMKISKENMNKTFGLIDIDRDQQEFTKTIRNPEIRNTIRVIDEWNGLEDTGENSSVEKAMYDYFSDVMAQRFIHKISCSPREAPDGNALIYLDVISTDKVRKINHCKLYYKTYSAGVEYKQLLGTVSISIEEVLKQKWYQQYRRRKFEKMDLILKEGIYRPRTLEYMEIIERIVEKLKNLATMTTIINSNIVRNFIKAEFRRGKIPQSIIGEELSTREVMGMLELYKGKAKINKELRIIEQKKRNIIKKGNKEMIEMLDTQEAELLEARKSIIEAIKLQKEEMAKYIEINNKYNKRLEGAENGNRNMEENTKSTQKKRTRRKKEIQRRAKKKR